MKWLLKRLLCVIGIHFHSKRQRFLVGYGDGTFDNPSRYEPRSNWKRIPDNADPLDYSCGCLLIPRIADVCPVCGHRRRV